LSEQTYPAAGEADVPEWGKDYGSKRRSSKPARQAAPKTSNNGGWSSNNAYADDVSRDDGWGQSDSRQAPQKKKTDDFLNHEF